MSHSAFGWYCLDHRMFLEDHDAVNDHIDSVPSLIPHRITGVANMLDGEEFPPGGESPFTGIA